MEIRTYRMADGRRPFWDWHAGLDRAAVVHVDRALARLTNGNLSSTKSVGAGVMEFRIDFGPGYRIYFGRIGQEIVVLLAGGDKRRQQRDIDAAITWWADYKSRARENRTGGR
jgi:putative addiction module killer protein